MEKFVARLLFVMSPAMAFGMGTMMAFDSPAAGLIVAAAFAGFGMDMTHPRPERGEGK